MNIVRSSNMPFRQCLLLCLFAAISLSIVDCSSGGRRLLDSPEVPKLPFEVPKPELPKLEVPKLPELPKPELPKVPDLPKPELPNVPELPKPELPKFPELPKPELPKVPELPKLPELPKVELPKLDLPQLPNGPNLIPELPKPAATSKP